VAAGSSVPLKREGNYRRVNAVFLLTQLPDWRITVGVKTVKGRR